jgi:hypothetical protein
MREKVLVEALSMLTSTRQPGGDRRLSVTLRPVQRQKDPTLPPARRAPGRSGGRGFSNDTEACCDGRVKVVRHAWQRNVWIGSARPCLPSPKSRMEVSVSVANVLTLRVRTSEALGVYAFGGSPPAFHLAPGTHRHRRWLSSRRGSGGVTTGGAIVWAAGRCRRRWSVLRLDAIADWEG